MFQALDVGKGDRVALFLPNCPEYLICWFGLSALGAISVPVNTAYKRDETAYILNHAGAKALVAHQSLLLVADQAVALADCVEYKLVVEQEPGSQESSDQETPAAPSGNEHVSDDRYREWVSFARLLDNSGVLSLRPRVLPEDVSMLVYTSGTTGEPKGVMVTHQMYVAAGQGFCPLDPCHG